MLFKERHIELIRTGEKTVTRRDWADNYHPPNPGTITPVQTHMMQPIEEAPAFIRILDRYPEPLGEMTAEDAQAEGDYETVAEFRETWESINDDGWDLEKEVTVVPLEYVGPVMPGMGLQHKWLKCADCQEYYPVGGEINDPSPERTEHHAPGCPVREGLEERGQVFVG